MSFYDKLPLINSFCETAEAERYIPLPDDWWLAAADIRGSTDAIRLGRYKEVNMAGASVIAALNNLYGDDRMLPYLFGGDGALVALPPEHIEEAKGILVYCRHAVKDAFGLTLASGLVSMREARKNGYEVSVARLHVSDAIDQAVFWGSGITWAEDLVKSRDLLEGVAPRVADFSGLECRWSQIPSNREEIVSYIIQANGGSDEKDVEIYDECFERITEIYGSELEYHPVNGDALELTFRPDLLRIEWRLRSHGMSWFGKLRYAVSLFVLQFIGMYLMKRRIKTEATEWGRYKEDLIKHVDYRKFGDALRFVATGTIRQRRMLTEYLDEQFRARRLCYGVHPSFAAMITCYVKSYQRNHVHFVDGTDGGYAKASQELKSRRRDLKQA